MPVYEYVCSQCHKSFEHLLRSMDSKEQVRCPECGAGKVRRQLSVFAARRGAAPEPAMRGGCGRCGDPNGPCAM